MKAPATIPLPLDDPIAGAVRKSDPISSVVAGMTVDAESQKARIYEALELAGRPLTVAQLVDRTGIPRDEVASRLPVMKRKNLVRIAGMVDNDRGRPVQQWTLVAPAT
jgi:predicted ArsR family transcriptional regulator